MRWAVLLTLIAFFSPSFSSAQPADVPASASDSSVLPPPAASSHERVSVYGLEFDVGTERERLLVFASSTAHYELIERDERTLELHIPNATLDASAPERLAPDIGQSVVWVRAREELGEVVVAITRAPGRRPEVSSRGSMIALDFPGLGDIDGEIALQFRDAAIADVVRGVADATGEGFVFDPELPGRVTIVVADPVSSAEALELLDSALLLLGLVALPTPGGPRKIVPIENGAHAAPWHPESIGTSDRFVATLVRLHAADADQLASTLEPWLGDRATAVASAQSNCLILSGAESHLQSLLVMVGILDDAASESLLVRRMNSRSAAGMRDILLDWAEGAFDNRSIDAWAIESSEMLVVKAAPRDLAAIRQFIERIDQPRSGSGNLHFIPIRDRDAAELANLLTATLGGELDGRDYAVSAYPPTNSLLVRADPETSAVIKSVVDDLDHSLPQVRVIVKLIEVTTPKSFQFSLDAFLPISKPDSRSFNVLSLSPSTANQLSAPAASRGAFVRAPLLIPLLDPAGLPTVAILPREALFVTADQREIHTKIVMQPELLMTSGDSHELFVGDEIPIPIANTTSNADLALQTNLNIERQGVGVRLNVMPTVNESGRVHLDFELDVSSLLPPLAGSAAQVGPTIQQRHFSTNVWLESQEFAVVALAESKMTERLETGVPLLKDLPSLGWMFRRTGDSETVSRLLVAISAEVVPTRSGHPVTSIRHRLSAERRQSWLAAFAPASDENFAVRAATRSRLGDAHAIADFLRARDEMASVVASDRDGVESFDVYLRGFDSLADAISASLRAAGPLTTPEVVALPRSGPSVPDTLGF